MNVPVSVDISSIARAPARRRLAILAPHTVRGLRVDESVGVDDGENVEIVLVHVGFDLGRVGIVGEQLVGHVFDRHARNPFTRVYIAMPDNGRSLAAPAPSKNVDARDRATLDGCAGRDEFGVGGIGRHEVFEKHEMVGICMVCVEPGRSGEARCDVSVY